ncbi:MAG: YggT family protein [Acidimicrobiaceae bacterium]|nr:YggT family protein [Acidimicrobiaceae bacterium]
MVSLLRELIYIYIWIIFIAIIFTWVPQSSGTLANIRRVLFSITDPVLRPIRSVVRPIRVGPGSLDLSPIIAVVLLEVISRLL